MDKDNTTQEMTLEQIFGRLDEITSSLEDASVGLEASFALYKEGSELLKSANGRIDLVRKQVQVLQQTGSGEEFTLSPFDENLAGNEQQGN